MKDNIFSIIERFTGESLNIKSVNNLKKLNLKERINLVERIGFNNRMNHWYVDNAELPIFDIFPNRESILTDSEGNYDSYEIWQTPDLMKNLLLYHESIAVLDPVDETLQQAAEIPDLLSNQIIELLPMRELIEKDIIRLVPHSTAKKAVIDQIDISGLLDNVFSCDDKSDLFEGVKCYSPDDFEMIKNRNLNIFGGNLTQREKHTIKEISNANEDYSFGSYMWASFIIKELYIQKRIAELNQSQIGAISNKYVRFYNRISGFSNEEISNLGSDTKFVSKFLLSLNLPKSKNISWADIISIRKNDEDFKTWRYIMKEILAESQYKTKYNESLFIKNAEDIIIARTKLLRDSIRGKKSIKDKFKNVGLAAGINFVGGFVTGSFDTALLSAGLSSGMQLLIDIFTKKPKESETALLNHFTIFINQE